MCTAPQVAENNQQNAQAQERRKSRLDQELRLIERCLDGEEAAWEDLIKIHAWRVYTICYRFTSSEQDAQDVTQEVFLRVFRSLNSFRPEEGPFVVWLGKLARNRLIDHYRSKKYCRVTESIEEKLPMIEKTQTISECADGMLARREASETLQSALQKLPPVLRETVILRDIDDLDYKKIAQMLNVAEGTVKSRLNRGRAELARIVRMSVWQTGPYGQAN